MPEDDERFEVKDRRKVLMGDDEEAAEAPPEEKREERREPPKQEEQAGKPGRPAAAGAGQMPPIDFVAFIGSLGASALMHLGEQLTPDQPPIETNLPAAQQMIDILDMIRIKTSGNLTQEEQASLDNLLYNLKIRFAHAAGGAM